MRLMIVPSAFSTRFAAMTWATAIVSFLYGSGLSGKEGQALAAEAASCRALSASLEEINRLAKGDIAALTISKTPLALPDLSFNGPEGAPVSLSSFHGKIVLLNIWATWCVPCRGEMPELDKLQADFGSEKFHVAAVNIDTTRLERPKALFQELGLTSLTFYADPKADIFYEMKQSGKALGLPLTLLLDPAGCQIGLLNGPAAWHSSDAKALISTAIKTLNQ